MAESDEPDVAELVSLLAPHYSRWQPLSCRLTHVDASHLLNASDPPVSPISLSLFPNLSYVWFDDGSELELDVSGDDPPYALDQVMIRGGGSSCSSLNRLIRNSPRLSAVLHTGCKDLHLRLGLAEAPELPVVHHLLTELTLFSFQYDPWIQQSLDGTTLPNLISFTIEFDISNYDVWSESLPHFLKRSSPPLENLDVDDCEDGLMIRSLAYVPTLRRLASYLHADEVSQILTCHDGSESKAGLDLVPNLEHLGLICTMDTNIPNLVGMVLSRWGGPSGHSAQGRLRSIILGTPYGDVTRELDDVLKEVVLKELEECINEGLEVSCGGE